MVNAKPLNGWQERSRRGDFRQAKPRQVNMGAISTEDDIRQMDAHRVIEDMQILKECGVVGEVWDED